MISITEQACIGVPVAEDAVTTWKPTGYMGISGVDAIIKPVLQRGGLVLVSGHTGSGKTVLAGQIASCMAMAGKKVAFLSTEVDEGELMARTLSCLAQWPYSELVNGFKLEDMGDLTVPMLIPDNEEFTNRALQPLRMLQRHLTFHSCSGFKDDPVEALNDLLDGDVIPEGVACLILDQMEFYGVKLIDGASRAVDVPDTAASIMMMLKEYAERMGIPVFVLCQRNHAAERQSKKELKAGRVGGISEFPGIEALADVTIELTYPVSRPSERHEDPGTGSYSRDRHFIITVAGNGNPVWVPVLADHGYQRFIGRQEGHAVDVDADVRFRRSFKESERPGFVKFPREFWEEILEIRHVPTRVVYVAMVLNAHEKTGNLNWSGPGLEKLLCMDDSVIRRALENLEALGLIVLKSGGGRGKLREWYVQDYKERFQNYDADNFVVLARNMLDEDHSPLRSDFRAFTVWLHLLFETRFKGDMDGELDRGQWPAEYKRLALDLKITVEEVKHAIQKLEDLGCIKRWNDPDWGNEIIMLPNYDCYQRMVPWPAKQGGRTPDKPRTNHGQTTDELRAIKADELAILRLTNSGQTTDELRTNCGRTSDEPRTIKETCKHENR